jgi:hypothetical protein
MTTSCSCDSCGNELCPGDVLCGTCGVECDPDKTRGFVTRRAMNRGETKQIDYTLVDEDGQLVDLEAAGVKLWFTVKDYLSRADSQAAWQGTLVSGIVILSEGKVRVTMPATVTQYLTDGIEKLYYDLKLLDGFARATVIEKGLFEIEPSTTKAIS